MLGGPPINRRWCVRGFIPFSLQFSGLESPLERPRQSPTLRFVNRNFPHHFRSTQVDDSDPMAARRAELLRMPSRLRLVEIEAELKAISSKASAAVTFHRKKLLRMHDDARLAAKLVTPARLQQENSPFAGIDFAKASIVWQPRTRVSI